MFNPFFANLVWASLSVGRGCRLNHRIISLFFAAVGLFVAYRFSKSFHPLMHKHRCCNWKRSSMDRKRKKSNIRKLVTKVSSGLLGSLPRFDSNLLHNEMLYILNTEILDVGLFRTFPGLGFFLRSHKHCSVAFFYVCRCFCCHTVNLFVHLLRS